LILTEFPLLMLVGPEGLVFAAHTLDLADPGALQLPFQLRIVWSESRSDLGSFFPILIDGVENGPAVPLSPLDSDHPFLGTHIYLLNR